MKPRSSLPIASLFALVAGAFGGSAKSTSTAAPVFRRPVITGLPSRQTYRSNRRRKNPFRGTTYAAHYGVTSHI